MDEEFSHDEKTPHEPRVQFNDTTTSPPPTRLHRPPTPRPFVPEKRPLEDDDEDDVTQVFSTNTQSFTRSRPRLSSPDHALLGKPLHEDEEASNDDSLEESTPRTQPSTPAAPPSTPDDGQSTVLPAAQRPLHGASSAGASSQPPFPSEQNSSSAPTSSSTLGVNNVSSSAGPTPLVTASRPGSPALARTSTALPLYVGRLRNHSWNSNDHDALRRGALMARSIGDRPCRLTDHALQSYSLDDVEVEQARNRPPSAYDAGTSITCETSTSSSSSNNNNKNNNNAGPSTVRKAFAEANSDVGADLGIVALWPWGMQDRWDTNSPEAHKSDGDTDIDKSSTDDEKSPEHPSSEADQSISIHTDPEQQPSAEQTPTATQQHTQPPENEDYSLQGAERDAHKEQETEQTAAAAAAAAAAALRVPHESQQAHQTNTVQDETTITPTVVRESHERFSHVQLDPTRDDQEDTVHTNLPQASAQLNRLKDTPYPLHGTPIPLQSVVASPTDNYRRPADALHSLHRRITAMQARALSERVVDRQQQTRDNSHNHFDTPAPAEEASKNDINKQNEEKKVEQDESTNH